MTPAFRRGAARWIAVAMVLLAGRSVRASSGRVALVQPTVADATVTEALHRIQGELVAEGFEVVLVGSQPPLDRTGRESDSLRAIEPPALPDSVPPGVLAAIDLAMNEGTHVVELRVIDRATDKVVVRRVPVEATEASRAAEVLSVRAVELLRASLLELLVARHPSPAVAVRPPPDLPDLDRAARWAAKTLRIEREPMWALEAGAAVMADLGGIPPSAVALVRVQRKLGGPLRLRATAAGLGTLPRVAGPAGTALVTQYLGLVEMVYDVPARAIVHPLLTAGAGALYVAVDGRANAPYMSERATQWAAAVDAGAGAELRLGRNWNLSLEAHALLAVPYPVVEFLGTEAAHTGTPSLLASLTVAGWL